jgi:hypothetical protein
MAAIGSSVITSAHVDAGGNRKTGLVGVAFGPSEPWGRRKPETSFGFISPKASGDPLVFLFFTVLGFELRAPRSTT